MAYRYSRFRPAPSRMAFDELPDHRFGYNCRHDPAAPPEYAKRYLAECTCGWRDPQGRWMSRKKFARMHWQGHMVEAQRQGRLAV